jgi:hypothetical protein
MIDLLLKVLKSLEDVGQKESFLKFMVLLASGTEMSEEPIDDIELEEAEPVDGSFLDVSLVEEVNSNSQENYFHISYMYNPF